MIKRILVVGASGYLGGKLLNSAKNISLSLGTSTTGANGLRYFRLDENYSFEDLSIGIGDIVFFTAAVSAPDICAREPNRAWAVNVTGTSFFIDSVIEKGARVVFFSSDAVYGERECEFDEAAECHPAGIYAKMKHEVEKRFLGKSSFKTIRLSYVFSREDRLSCYLVSCAERNERVKLFHPFFRSIVYSDDVVKGALALANSWEDFPEQIINFGGPQILSRVNFAQCLREAHLHNLCFDVTEPPTDFFNNRPRIIAMASPIFARLLGRSPRRLSEAAHLEFSSSSDLQRFP